jgi:hypothetical protein
MLVARSLAVRYVGATQFWAQQREKSGRQTTTIDVVCSVF